MRVRLPNPDRPRLPPLSSSVPPDLPEPEVEIKPLKRRLRTENHETRGDMVVAMCQTLKVPDGPDVGKMVVLRDWQINIIKEVYDPIYPGTLFPEDIRIIREAVWTMGRKNAKTTSAAMLLLCHLVGPEAVRNGQSYSAAFDASQAAIVYRAANAMIQMDSELSFLTRCTDSTKIITCPRFGTTYKALTAESRTKHGFNSVFVIMDELAQFGADRELYDALKTSMGAQNQSLMLTISTQAADDGAVLSQLIDYGRAVAAGEIVDPSFKLFEFTVPMEDDKGEDIDCFNEALWPLANPALGDFRSLVELRQYAERAKRSPSVERTFRNLYLNQRVSSLGGFVSRNVWKANGGAVDLERLLGRKAHLGLDLSGKIDLTAAVLVFEDEENTVVNQVKKGRLIEGSATVVEEVVEEQQSTFDIVPYFWTPEATLEERTKRDKAPYLDWVELGYMKAIPGSSIDYAVVAREIKVIFEMFDIQTLTFDRWRMDTFKQFLSQVGIDESIVTFVPCGQGFRDMGPAVEVTEEALLAQRLRHGMHPVLKHNAASAVIVKDPAENKKFEKAKSYGRIDGIVAMSMALKTAILGIDLQPKVSVYEKRGIVVFGGHK